MARQWDRFWLYARLAVLAALALFVLQLFLINVSRDAPPRMFVGTDWLGGVWVLIAAFVLGVCATPLYRASRRMWKDFKTEKAREREEIAAQAVQKSLGNIPRANQRRESEPAPSGPPAAAPKPGPGGKPEGKSAADVWTSGEDDAGG